MTTKHSPLSAIKKQADKIAAMLKAFERGEEIDPRFAESMKAARTRDYTEFVIAMDDKILKVKMAWAIIRATDEAALSEYIVDQMRETRLGAPH